MISPLNINIKISSDSVLTVLLLFSLIAVPVMPGHTTSKISVFVFTLMVLYLLVKGRFNLNRGLLVMVVLYVLFILSLYQELLIDIKLLMQFMSSTAFLLVLTVWWDRLDSRSVIFPLLIAIFLSGLMYFPIMIFGPLTGAERLDVLYWQKDTGFFYGINKFLISMFVINLVLLTAQKSSGFDKLLSYIFPVLYFFLAIYLGSRSHALLGFLSFVLMMYRGAVGRIGGKILVSLIFIGAIIFMDKVIRLLEVNVLDRLARGMSDFDSSPRGRIFNVFTACLEKSEFLYGNSVMGCVSSSVGDLDNAFMFAISSGGLVAAILLFALVFLMFAYVVSSGLSVSIKAYIIFSYIVLMNVDVIVMKAVFFLPMFICLLNYKNGVGSKGDYKSPANYVVIIDPKENNMAKT